MGKYKLKKEIVMEYDDSLLGLRPPISTYYFDKDAFANSNLALELIKYAVETRLKWDPYQIREYLTMDILKFLKLDHVYKFIKFPPELDSKTDMFYIAWALYPETQNRTYEELELRPYKALLNNEISKLPVGFFSDFDGLRRAGNCLIYVIENYHPFESKFDMYEFFSTFEAKKFLKKMKLNRFCNTLYDNPLEYLHCSLSENEASNLFYSFFYFKKNYESNFGKLSNIKF